MPFQISRFAATSKALRLIKNHAALFQKVIGLNAKTTYDILFHCHTIAKESLKKHMDDSLYAVVTEIAHYVVINSPLVQPGAKDALEPSNTKKRKVNDSGISIVTISLNSSFFLITAIHF